MVKLKYKYAIGCLIQWYEVEMVEEYLQSVKNALKRIENKENVIVDLYFNMSTALEKIDESKMDMFKIIRRFSGMEEDLKRDKINLNVQTLGGNMLHELEVIYTIADYRRDFNDKYCEKVDVLMWGESDSLIPGQTFEVLDLLHDNNTNQNIYKYVTFFGGCKMWDDSWKPVEHNDFTDKPFIENDIKNWWSLRYVMNIDEMNKINDKVEELDVRNVNPFKFNGCGLVISSDIVKAGVNIPRSAFFIHEDTAFMFSLMKTLGNEIPQFVFKNILLVHNRKHVKKRFYVKGENDVIEGDVSGGRLKHNWYKRASDMSHHNTYNMFNQSKIYTWKDVFDV